MTASKVIPAKIAHQAAAKLLRYAKYDAKCVFNAECDWQPYEVHVKCGQAEAMELQYMLAATLKCDILNVISKA